MAAVYLKMGKSTVLRFPEKPRKVVVGNQNYYGIEFIETDVAIQPLGAVGTNLFVYTDHHTYGFLLTPGDRYDDLVFVRWKFAHAGEVRAPKEARAKSSTPNVSFLVGKALRVTVTQVTSSSAGLLLIDSNILNTGKEALDISKLELRAFRAGKIAESQTFAIEGNQIKPGEKTKARIVLKAEKPSELSIEGKIGSLSGKGYLPRKFL